MPLIVILVSTVLSSVPKMLALILMKALHFCGTPVTSLKNLLYFGLRFGIPAHPSLNMR